MCGPKPPTRCYGPVVECTDGSLQYDLLLSSSHLQWTASIRRTGQVTTNGRVHTVQIYNIASQSPKLSSFYILQSRIPYSSIGPCDNANYSMQECIVLVVGSRWVTLLSNGSLWCKLYMPLRAHYCTIYSGTPPMIGIRTILVQPAIFQFWLGGSVTWQRGNRDVCHEHF